MYILFFTWFLFIYIFWHTSNFEAVTKSLHTPELLEIWCLVQNVLHTLERIPCFSQFFPIFPCFTVFFPYFSMFFCVFPVFFCVFPCFFVFFRVHGAYRVCSAPKTNPRFPLPSCFLPVSTDGSGQNVCRWGEIFTVGLVSGGAAAVVPAEGSGWSVGWPGSRYRWAESESDLRWKERKMSAQPFFLFHLKLPVCLVLTKRQEIKTSTESLSVWLPEP